MRWLHEDVPIGSSVVVVAQGDLEEGGIAEVSDMGYLQIADAFAIYVEPR